MYETFDHTADVGLRIRADTLPGLLAEAGRALFSVLVANLDEVRPVQQLSLAVAGQEHDELLHDWLAELLFTFETRHTVFSRFDVELDDAGLRAVAWGEPIDPERHVLEVEIKAITWHGLKVERDGDGWLAEVIVDI